METDINIFGGKGCRIAGGLCTSCCYVLAIPETDSSAGEDCRERTSTGCKLHNLNPRTQPERCATRCEQITSSNMPNARGALDLIIANAAITPGLTEKEKLNAKAYRELYT